MEETTVGRAVPGRSKLELGDLKVPFDPREVIARIVDDSDFDDSDFGDEPIRRSRAVRWTAILVVASFVLAGMSSLLRWW